MEPDGLLIFNVQKKYMNFYLFMLVCSSLSFYSIHYCCFIKKKKEDNKASVFILFILLSVRIH